MSTNVFFSVVSKLTELGWGEELESMKPHYNAIADHNLVRGAKRMNDKGKSMTAGYNTKCLIHLGSVVLSMAGHGI